MRLTARGKPKLGGRIRRIAILLLSVLALLSAAAPVYAESWRVNVLIAYDEEWQTIAHIVYAHSPETLAALLVSEVDDRFRASFNIRFFCVAHTSWSSNDYPNDVDDMIEEVIEETDFVSGMTVGGFPVHIMAVFTGQNIPDCWGYSNRELGVVLVQYAYPDGVGQATDNILQHEISHLYGAPDHYQDDLDCVMNGYPYWIGFPYYYYVPTALVTNNWCSGCIETINNNKTLWGKPYNAGGGRLITCAW